MDWKNTTNFDAVIFDCDGTLASIEGIDELARMKNVYKQVEAITSKAMSEGGLNIHIYEKRLELTQPTKTNIEKLSQLYLDTLTPNTAEVIDILKSLSKTIYIVSAGILPAILPLAKQLNIAAKNVFAVDIYFNEYGQYLDFDRQSPLINTTGKVHIIKLLKQRHKNLLLIGDGKNDLAVASDITRFVGFGGNYYREAIKNGADFYIEKNDMTALLPLCLTESELNILKQSKDIV